MPPPPPPKKYHIGGERKIMENNGILEITEITEIMLKCVVFL